MQIILTEQEYNELKSRAVTRGEWEEINAAARQLIDDVAGMFKTHSIHGDYVQFELRDSLTKFSNSLPKPPKG